jgi:hypothetical protein
MLSEIENRQACSTMLLTQAFIGDCVILASANLRVERLCAWGLCSTDECERWHHATIAGCPNGWSILRLLRERLRRDESMELGVYDSLQRFNFAVHQCFTTVFLSSFCVKLLVSDK